MIVSAMQQQLKTFFAFFVWQKIFDRFYCNPSRMSTTDAKPKHNTPYIIMRYSLRICHKNRTFSFLCLWYDRSSFKNTSLRSSWVVLRGAVKFAMRKMFILLLSSSHKSCRTHMQREREKSELTYRKMNDCFGFGSLSPHIGRPLPQMTPGFFCRKI